MSTLNPQTSSGNLNTGERYGQVPENAHDVLDSKDQRSFGNTLSATEQNKKEQKRDEQERAEIRPTGVAKLHGNKPSRGAEIDEELENEEHHELKREGKI